MLSHTERLATARAAVAFITGRSAEEQARPVPNCPDWTVYNAAAHIGRVAIAWEEMISSAPDDPESRTRGYDRSGGKPPGTSVTELAGWANAAIDRLDDDLDRPCYFSMTGGEGTVALWGWHAATELGIHRLDVEAALGYDHAMSEAQALDAITYTAQYFLPAMRRATGTDPGRLTIVAEGATGTIGQVDLQADGQDGTAPANPASEAREATIGGPAVEVTLALWGRPSRGVRLVDGDPEVWAAWQALPGQAFQFGTWD
jgi:uncharacterized protein (TIGR03083 family)